MKPESTLSQLKIAFPEGPLPSSYGVYFKNTLVALCHALEDVILQINGISTEQQRFSQQPTDQQPLVLVTFQEGKWYLQEADRYEQIADCSRQVIISALPDSGFSSHATGQHQRVDLVSLQASDDLTREWNLIIVAPAYQAMVLCYELSDDDYLPTGKPEVDTERKFYGLWTFDQTLVTKAAEILVDRLRPYNPELADRTQQLQQEILATPTIKPVDLSSVVNRIVNYLQTSQQQLVVMNRQTRELWELEGRALRVSRNLNANKLQAFLRMAQRVDEQDHANPVASLQVAALSETLGQLLDLPTVQLRRLRLAGLLFRAGLASAPNQVFLHEPEKLDEATKAFWDDRATLTAQLLQAMPELDPVRRIVLHHLEHWNGSGKPSGLRGEDIAIESRILALVTYFQELTQPRGERSALSLGNALEQCQHYSNSRFDPMLVSSLANVVKLAEMGMMTLPERPSQLPNVWLEEPIPTPTHHT